MKKKYKVNTTLALQNLPVVVSIINKIVKLILLQQVILIIIIIILCKYSKKNLNSFNNLGAA